MRILQRMMTLLLTITIATALPARAQGDSPGSGAAREKLTKGKIAEDLGRHDEARAIFGALVADDGTPRDLGCEALVRQAAVTWQHVDVTEGIALLKLARETCASDREAMRLLVGVITGVEQDPETWRGRNEDFFVAIVDGPGGPEPMVAFTDEPGRDPFSPASAETPSGGRAWRGDPVSVQVQDATLADIFRLLHEVSGLNIVVQPDIGKKTITLEMVDVPWDQMLDLILRTQGLAASVSGNVMRIGSIERLAAERFAGSAADLASQVRTMESLRAVALAVAERRGLAGSWPVSPRVSDVATLEQDASFFRRDVPSSDAWGNPLRYWSDGKLLRIASPGSDGVFEHPDLAGYVPTVARHPQDDLVWQDGEALTMLASEK